MATEFREVMAVAQRDRHAPFAKGKRAAQSTFTTRMYDQSGREAGFVRWFAKERVLTWRFPNGREGVAMESKVPGGFKFTPTLAWANVQALAFLRQSERPAPPAIPVPAMQADAVRERVGRAAGARSGASPGAGNRLGCDGVGKTAARDCTSWTARCSRSAAPVHDRCYERDYQVGDCCEAWSWFFPNPVLALQPLQRRVVRCFVTTAFDPWDGLSWDVGCTPRDTLRTVQRRGLV